MDKIIVTIFGLLGIGFTYYYFLGKKENIVEASDTLDVSVDGGYKPSSIIVKRGSPITRNFQRLDPNPCLEEIVIPDFKIHKTLPLNQKVPISITPNKSGTFPFSCGMNMFHGKIIVST